jgi:hypothetical protein
LKNQHGFFISFTLSAFLISALLFVSCQKGNQGIAGTAGTNGTNGVQGASGNTILSGDSVPSLTLGIIGDYYLELDSSNLYGPKTSLGWGSPVSLTGTAGATGAMGDTGVTGAQGGGLLVDTFSVTTADWTTEGYAYAQYTNDEAYVYPTQQYLRNNSNITPGIIDSGLVLVYFTSVYSVYPNGWLPLPYSIAELSTPAEYNWSYVLNTNSVVLEFYLTPLSTSTAALPAISSITVPYARYKIVVVSGTLTHQIINAIHKKVSKMEQISID